MITTSPGKPVTVSALLEIRLTILEEEIRLEHDSRVVNQQSKCSNKLRTTSVASWTTEPLLTAGFEVTIAISRQGSLDIHTFSISPDWAST